MTDATAPTTPVQRERRRRTLLACVPCRMRKSKCDGANPCGSCQALEYECKYPAQRNSANVIVGREYLSDLQRRVEVLESSVRSINQQLSSDGRGESIVASPVTATNDAVPLSGLDQPANQPAQSASDVMGTVLFSDEAETGYFGPSSNIRLLRVVAEILLEQENISFSSPQTQRPLFIRTFAETVDYSSCKADNDVQPNRLDTLAPITRDHVNLLLPGEEEGMELIRAFFANTGALFPYLFEQRFVAKYRSMFRGKDFTHSRSWLSLLCMVFAMTITCAVDQGASAPVRRQKSERFAHRAIRFSGYQIMRGPDIETVQFLLLWAQYLQGTQKSVESWTVHGLIVKICIQLGLHCSYSNQHDPIDREIRKRTWLGCVALDRTLSMTFGRPFMIPECWIHDEQPLEVFGEVDSAEETSISEASSGNADFFAASVKLYSIGANTIENLYGYNLGFQDKTSLSELITQIFRLEERTADWKQALPPWLHPVTPSQMSVALTDVGSDSEASQRLKHRTVLTLRYLSQRLLVHRPILLRVLESQRGIHAMGMPDTSPISSLSSHSIDMSVEAAKHALSLFEITVGFHEPRKELLGAWWFSLHYAFNAALTLFSCYLIRRWNVSHGIGHAPVDHDDIRGALTTAIESLSRLDTENDAVERCCHCLQILIRASFQSDKQIWECNPRGQDPAHEIGTALDRGFVDYFTMSYDDGAGIDWPLMDHI